MLYPVDYNLNTVRLSFLKGWEALTAIRRKWYYRFLPGLQRNLALLSEAVLSLREQQIGLDQEVQNWQQAQVDILASMENVRERNRRLEGKMAELGLSNAQINGGPILDDADWQKAIYLFGRELEQHFTQLELVYGRHYRPNFQLMANFGDERVQRVAKIVNGAMEMERSGMYPEDDGRHK
jgi:hypothetical protein